MFKKLLSVTLSVLMTLALIVAPVSADNAFPDVTAENYSWAVNEIEEMTKLGIIAGYTDGTFKPAREISKIEALILSARILGYTDSANKPFTELAKELYADDLTPYDTGYENEVAYLLYKDVLKLSDVVSYIGGENANSPMKRYEVAVLLTKVLGAEGDVSMSVATTSYADSVDIPATAKPYVEYVTEEGIMNGMSETEFVPMGSVTRAQMAVLLYRLMNKMDQEIEIATMKAFDAATNRLTYITSDNKTAAVNISYGAASIVKKDGFASDLSRIAPSSIIAIVRRGGVIYAVEAITVVGDEVVEAIFSSLVSGGNTSKIKVYFAEDPSALYEYVIAENFVVTKNGSSAKLTDLNKTDAVTLTISSGEVSTIVAKSKDENIKGTVSEIILSPSVAFVITLTDGEEVEYKLATDASVKRNGAKATADEVLVGDNISATVTYGELASIIATSTKHTATGTIEAIYIATLPTITVKANGASTTYSLSRSATYTVNGEEADIYALRLNSTVTLNVEGDTVTRVASTLTGESSALVGTIKNVNSSYGFITFVYEENDTQKEMFVFIKTATKIMDTATGKMVSSSALKEKQTISVTGAMNMGAFEATTIVIMP